MPALTLDFDGTRVISTPTNAVLALLYHQPGIWHPVCEIMQCKRSTGHMRLKRAAEKIRARHPLLGATLRDVRWRGEWAMLSTAYRICD